LSEKFFGRNGVFVESIPLPPRPDDEVVVRAIFETNGVKVGSLVVMVAGSVLALPIFYLIQDFERSQANRCIIFFSMDCMG
jgi:hypothetical protein